MRVLWGSLTAEAQAKTHTSKKVSDIVTTDDGVVVNCSDGTSYEGAVVVGADGAYSVVRKHMRLMALRDQQGKKIAPMINEEKPFLTSYRCLWVLIPVLPGLKVGDANETHGNTTTIQFFVGEDAAIMGVYERMDKPKRDPGRYNKADEKVFIDNWGHLPLTKGGQLTLGQAYARKIESGLINLEEGVVKNWSWGGRMVLVGDAAHKFTPSTGSGCNNGIVDIVVLANQLHRAFSSGVPSSDTLAVAFKEYQDARYDVVTEGCSIASNTTAMATWSNVVFKFLDLYVFSIRMLQKFFIGLGTDVTAKTPVFDYIEGKEEIVGKVPWAYAIPSSRMLK